MFNLVFVTTCMLLLKSNLKTVIHIIQIDDQ